MHLEQSRCILVYECANALLMPSMALTVVRQATASMCAQPMTCSPQNLHACPCLIGMAWTLQQGTAQQQPSLSNAWRTPPRPGQHLCQVEGLWNSLQRVHQRWWAQKGQRAPQRWLWVELWVPAGTWKSAWKLQLESRGLKRPDGLAESLCNTFPSAVPGT